MNKPYLKKYNELGQCINPISELSIPVLNKKGESTNETIMQTQFANRSSRRLSSGRTSTRKFNNRNTNTVFVAGSRRLDVYKQVICNKVTGEYIKTIVHYQ